MMAIVAAFAAGAWMANAAQALDDGNGGLAAFCALFAAVCGATAVVLR